MNGWVAVKELELSYYNKETLLLLTVYPYSGNLIFKFLKSSPDDSVTDYLEVQMQRQAGRQLFALTAVFALVSLCWTFVLGPWHPAKRNVRDTALLAHDPKGGDFCDVILGKFP